tara:strand:- start:22 stop:180 length:159 start_codon:yes stop_codon:yes gene_type:complete
MENNWLIYGGIFLIVYFLVKFLMANKSVEKKIAANLQEVVNGDKYKVRGKFE